MTVATINSTVTVVVSAELGMGTASSYAPAIAKVSEALEAREYDLVDAIAERANEVYGVSKHEVAGLLHNLGMAERPAPAPVEEEAPVTADDVAKGKLSKGERIAKLEEGQAAILEGLAALKALAERHLGASL